MKRTILAAAAILLLSFPLASQTQGEKKMYQKTIRDASLKAYIKFLNRYPDSVYALEIEGKKDTLLNVSPYSVESATQIATGFFPEKTGIKAFGWRNEGKDYIIAFRLDAEGVDKDGILISDLEKTEKGWKVATESTYPADSPDSLISRRFLDDSQKIDIDGTEQFYFVIKSEDESGKSMLSYSLYDQNEQSRRAITILCKKPKDGKTEYRMHEPSDPHAEEIWLKSRIMADTTLVQISDADWKTDEYYDIWEEKNPDALTSASKISAIILPEDCSLVKEFNAQKRKISCGQYKAAMFDFREKTVIVAFEKNSGNHVLEWIEPVCENPRTDRLLNSISLKSGTTIEMFYYKGSRTFKYLFNLSSKTLRR